MIDGELKYSSDKLYSQLDQRYFSFRKEALKGKFVGDEEPEERSISPFSILPDMLSSGSDQHESENDEAVVTLSLDDSLDNNQLPLITSVSSLSSRTEIESDNTGDTNTLLLPDVSSKPKRPADEAKEEDQILVVETESSDENGISLIMQDGLASSESGNENEKTTRKRKVAQSPSSASFVLKKRRINRIRPSKRLTKKKEEGVARLEVELPYLKDTADNHNGTMKTDRTKGTVGLHH